MSKSIIVVKGLPASGKSTWARDTCDVNPGVYIRVNKDDLRRMMFPSNNENGHHFTKANEARVLEMRDEIVRMGLRNGKSVIVDDTNLVSKHHDRMREIAAEFDNVTVRTQDFTGVPLEECLRRNRGRQWEVPERVIRDMYNKHIKEDPFEIPHDPDLSNCIIVDIDGTIAHMNGRSPYDWSRVEEDTFDEVVWSIATLYAKTHGVEIILMSGRDSSCREETMRWLERHGALKDVAIGFMRRAGDQRKDTIVKRELYEENIRGVWNVDFVLDDRRSIVDMWRSLGLKVFQVAEGNF